MRRRRIPGLGWLSLTALTLIVGTHTASPDPPSTIEQAENLAKSYRVARAFLEIINELRSEEESPPLRLSEPLSLAASILLEKAVIEPVIGDFDAETDLTKEELRASGYDPQQWAVGLASSKGEPSEIVALWRQADPQSFEAFLEPGLRDFGLAQEIWVTQPLYALVGATSRDQTNQPILDRLADIRLVRLRLLDRVNIEREHRRLRHLRLNRKLNAAAQTYADRMMVEGFYGHVAPQGDTVKDRIEAAGYRAAYAGENLASGPHSVELVMNSWMASEGHRKNVLDRRFRDLGLGLAILDVEGELKILWVQFFGRRRP